MEEYQKLIRLNILIEKQFQKASKDLTFSKKLKKKNLKIKNEKKI